MHQPAWKEHTEITPLQAQWQIPCIPVPLPCTFNEQTAHTSGSFQRVAIIPTFCTSWKGKTWESVSVILAGTWRTFCLRVMLVGIHSHETGTLVYNSIYKLYAVHWPMVGHAESSNIQHLSHKTNDSELTSNCFWPLLVGSSSCHSHLQLQIRMHHYACWRRNKQPLFLYGPSIP